MKPSIVLVITDEESNAQIAKLGVDFLELRVDLFKTIANSSSPNCRDNWGKRLDVDYARRQFQNRRRLGIPLILTVRNQKKEGAVKLISDIKKWALMQDLMPLADWVDIERSSPLCDKVVVLARNLCKRVVVSSHYFHNLPNNMEQILNKSLTMRADMVKIAAAANSPDGLIRMVNFTHNNRKYPLVTMCLGRWGALSRLILPAAGSRWVYTFLNKPTAPGQMDVKTFKTHLKFFYGI